MVLRFNRATLWMLLAGCALPASAQSSCTFPIAPYTAEAEVVCLQGGCETNLVPTAINDSQTVVGAQTAFFTNPYVTAGFMRKNNVTTGIQMGSLPSTSTVPLGINGLNQIVGYFFPSQVELFAHTVQAGDQGFLWDSGKFTVINYPGEAGTQLSGINSSGEIVGTYVTSDSYPNYTTHAFKYVNGVFTRLFPNSDSVNDIAWGINDAGIIIGAAFHPELPYAGFTMGPSGSISALAVLAGAEPWKLVAPEAYVGGVVPTGIANNGDISGYYFTAYSYPLTSGEFVLSAGATSLFSVSGTGVLPGASTINSAGQIIGGSFVPGSYGPWVTSCYAPVPASITYAAGDGQTGIVGTAFGASPLTLKVATASGAPAMGAAVSFVASSYIENFSIVNANKNVDPDGWVDTGPLFIPDLVMPITITATVAGLPPVHFNLYAESAQPAGLTYVSGTGQSGKVGAALSQPLVVKVSASDASPVSGAPVSFTITTGSGTVNPAVAVTASDGTASTVLTLGSTAVSIVTASVAGLATNITFVATATSNLTVLPGGIVNAASYAAPVAPGSLVSIFTSPFTAQAASATPPQLPSSLSGVSVTFNGVTAPMVAVSPAGANPSVTVQVPFEALPAGQAAATVPVVITLNGVPSVAAPTQIVASAPAIFTIPPTGLGSAVLVNLADYSIAAPSGSIPGLSAHPIPRGQAAYFYVTGLGAMTPSVPDGSGACPAASGICNANALPTVLVGGVPAQVLFAGQAVGFPGVMQVNIIVPQGAPTGGSVSLVVKSADGTVTSNSATVAVQ